ncbi:MAG: hypothetical protein GC131_02185 [Alphaproteobacteria bacterium]|nr:hypothetical protein [Alphaproteobacteria bacterium]
MAIKPVAVAGYLYNTGNVLMFFSPLILSQGDVIGKFVQEPIPAVAAIVFFLSGLAYGVNRFRLGSGFVCIAALILASFLFTQGNFVAAFFTTFFHAVGGFIGAFAESISRKLGGAGTGWLGKLLGNPPASVGYGGMISRLPLAVDVMRTGNWLLGCTGLIWLLADYILSRARPGAGKG